MGTILLATDVRVKVSGSAVKLAKLASSTPELRAWSILAPVVPVFTPLAIFKTIPLHHCLSFSSN